MTEETILPKNTSDQNQLLIRLEEHTAMVIPLPPHHFPRSHLHVGVQPYFPTLFAGAEVEEEVAFIGKSNDLFQCRPTAIAGPIPISRIFFFPQPFLHQDFTACTRSKRQSRDWVTWRLPPLGWLKINVDGSSFGNPGPAGAGGLVRDDRGNWVAGFSANIGVDISLLAELRVIKHGIQLALNRASASGPITGVVIESDCSRAISMVFNEYSPLLQEIRELRARLESVCEVRLYHVFRQANRCADFLAKRGVHQSEELTIHEEHPPELSCQLREDREKALMAAI